MFLSESRIIADGTDFADFKGIFVFGLCLAKTGAAEPGALRFVTAPIGVNFKKNNRRDPQAGRFGFPTEPDFTWKH